jgi:hypothetical protein
MARFAEDIHVDGRLSALYFTPPAQSIGSASINTSDPLPTAGLKHRHEYVVELAEEATAIVAINTWLAALKYAHTIISFEAFIAVQATDASRTVTVDLHKSTGGGAFATALSATAGITNATAVRTAVAGTVSSASGVAGDIYKAVVTVAGGVGTQAKGLTVRLIIDENPS